MVTLRDLTRCESKSESARARLALLALAVGNLAQARDAAKHAVATRGATGLEVADDTAVAVVSRVSSTS